jgi:translation elongation factor P/translation initiation factor 5A
MLDRESQNDSTIAYWSTDGNSFIITDQTKFEAVSIKFVKVSFSNLRL